MDRTKPDSESQDLNGLHAEAVRKLDVIFGSVAKTHFEPLLEEQQVRVEASIKELRGKLKVSRDDLKAGLNSLETAQRTGHEEVLHSIATLLGDLDRLSISHNQLGAELLDQKARITAEHEWVVTGLKKLEAAHGVMHEEVLHTIAALLVDLGSHSINQKRQGDELVEVKARIAAEHDWVVTGLKGLETDLGARQEQVIARVEGEHRELLRSQNRQAAEVLGLQKALRQITVRHNRWKWTGIVVALLLLSWFVFFHFFHG